jgi:signal transduction histidine kinase
MTVFGIRWRWRRPAQRQRGWDAALILTAVYAVAVYSGVMWSRSVENSTAFWAANGVLAAGLLLLRPRVAIAFAVICLGVNLGVNVVGRLPLELNLAFTSLNIAFSAAVAVLVRTFCGAALDLGRLRRFLPFLAIVAGAAVVEGMIGASMISGSTEQFLTIWRRWMACDGVGMVLGLPATLMMMRGVNPLQAGPANARERFALLAILGLGTYAAFAVAAAPVFLLIFPALLFAAFRLGSGWAFLAVWICGQAATIQTLAGRGPIAVFDGPPPFIELGLLQLFLVSILLTASLATSALAERMRAEQRLRRKAAATAAARARVDQITATRERFLAVISHEIRTPLNGIVGFGEALAKRVDLDPEARHHVEMIGRSTEALMGIVDDILDYARIESGRLDIKPEAASVEQTLARAMEAAAPLAAAKGLTLTRTGAALDDALHLVDSRRLQQVLGHLIDNAVKFTAAGGVEVRLDCEPAGDDDRLTVTVVDSGQGVPEHQRRDLFRPFAQLDPSLSRRHGGAGLGLSICRAVVDLMGGEISYAPGPAGGSVFRISATLPRAGVALSQDEGLGERAPRVLVVDDHPMNREVARLFLDAFGCEVSECEDGGAAVEAAAGGAFDVILMDVRMPGVDGLSATRMIRELGGPAALTPILAVTADVMRDDIERCRAAGMNGHVPKPIDQARLLNALSCALQGRDAFAADLAA